MRNLSENFFNRKALMIALIVLVGFTAYSFMLSGTFKHMDDNFSIVDNQDIKDFANIGKIFQKPFFDQPYYYRPMVSFSFMMEYHVFGLNPFFYNLTNLLLHLATAVTIFFLIGLIFRSQAISFFAALLFAVHPIHWEAVSNIAGRAIVLCAFFYFNAFLFYCLAREKKISAYYFLSLVFVSLALLSKETASTFPIMLMSYEFFIGRKEKKWVYQATRRLAPFFMLVVVYLFLRSSLRMNMFYWRHPSEVILEVLTFLRTMITYFRIFIFPVDLHFDRSRLVFSSFFDWELITTTIFFVVLLFILVSFRTKLKKEFLFFVSWIFIELLPVSQIIPIGIQFEYIPTAEHFFYTASLGVFVVMVLCFCWIYEEGMRRQVISKPAAIFFVTGLYVFLFLITVQQNIYSSNELAMLKRSAEYNQRNTRIQIVLGLSYVKKNSFKEAEKCFRKALVIEPYNAAARIALGKVLCDQGHFLEGATEYEKIVHPGKYERILKENLRLTYAIIIRQYQEMLKKDPRNAAVYYSLGVIYTKTAKTNDAITQYRRAVELRPDFRNALFNLASSLEAFNEPSQALDYYKKVLALGGQNDFQAYYANLHAGLVSEKLGDKDGAKIYFKKCLEINPRAAEVKAKLISQQGP